MTKETLKLTALAGLILSAPALAFAGLTLGDVAGKTVAEIRSVMEAQGYEVLEIEFERNKIEVEYLVDGTEYEAEINPATGMVIALELEDDHDNNDDDHGDDDD